MSCRVYDAHQSETPFTESLFSFLSRRVRASSTETKTCRHDPQAAQRAASERYAVMKHGHTATACAGYRTESSGGLEFYDVTTATARRARNQYQRRGDASRSPASPVSSSSTSDAPPAVPGAGVTTPVRSIERTPVGASSQGTDATPPFRSASPQTAMPGGAMNRTMLWGGFMHLYIPSDCKLQGDHVNFFKRCIDTPTPHPALLNSLDALSLVQLGSTNNDRRVLPEACQAYSRALGSLHQALSPETDQSRSDDQVLAAIMVLKVCEFFTELASPRGIGWGDHVSGVQQLIAVRGPESLKTDLALGIFAHARHSALCHGLITRKASYFAQPSWRAFGQRVLVRDESSVIHDIAVQVPGILEQHDNLDPQHESYTSHIDALLTDAAALEQEMRTWQSNSHKSTLGPPYHLRPVADFPTFAALCSDRTFATAHMFPGFTAAYLHATYWVCMYFLRSTVRALHVARASAVTGWSPSPSQSVEEEEMTGYIVDLCQCIPYFCEPATATAGCIESFLPMRTAAQYFLDRGMRMQVRWVGNVRRSVFNKGLAPPRLDRMKLSDLSDIAVD
ncbi:hypothetical protein LTR12_003107 [Friedmanniomyces endolithicus]|nr:hypothetical protein LTR12_003107 [Friedmanniomyces endolithicus]